MAEAESHAIWFQGHLLTHSWNTSYTKAEVEAMTSKRELSFWIPTPVNSGKDHCVSTSGNSTTPLHWPLIQKKKKERSSQWQACFLTWLSKWAVFREEDLTCLIIRELVMVRSRSQVTEESKYNQQSNRQIILITLNSLIQCSKPDFAYHQKLWGSFLKNKDRKGTSNV